MQFAALGIHALSPLGFGSQGRDLKLCLWDLAEGRNTIMDSVNLESVGFCKGSILARGQQHWTLAVPGRGSDEVSTSLHSTLFLCSWALSFPYMGTSFLAPGCRNAVPAAGPHGGRGVGLGLSAASKLQDP